MPKNTDKKTHPDFIWFNGALRPWQDANIHVMSHALHYGSSCFEGIRAYKTPNGPAIFRLKDHISRLFQSLKIYALDLPYSAEDVMEACRETLRKNALQAAYIRPLAFLGTIGLGLCPPKDTQPELAIMAFPWTSYLGEGSMEKGIHAAVSSWARIAPNTLPAAAKAGGNYLSSQLISREARRHGYQEGIALTVQGYVSEGAGENLFVLHKGQLITPPSSACILPGIRRDSTIQIARKLGIPIREENIHREALYLADEVFMTGTAAGIVPIVSIDQITIASGKPGPITQKLQQTFFGLFSNETKDEWGWLDFVQK